MMEKQHIEEVLQIIEEAMLKIKICIGRQSGKSNLQYKVNRAYLAIPELLKELIAYKDAEEQKLLLRLPCPIGTTVYSIISECEGDYFECYHACDTCRNRNIYIEEQKFDFDYIDCVGEWVFLTKEEAEAALQKIQEGKQ